MAKEATEAYLAKYPDLIPALSSALNTAAKEATMFAFPSPEADVAAARLLALAVFALTQQLIGLDISTWLRLSGDPTAAAASPPTTD